MEHIMYGLLSDSELTNSSIININKCTINTTTIEKDTDLLATAAIDLLYIPYLIDYKLFKDMINNDIINNYYLIEFINDDFDYNITNCSVTGTCGIYKYSSIITLSEYLTYVNNNSELFIDKINKMEEQRNAENYEYLYPGQISILCILYLVNIQREYIRNILLENNKGYYMKIFNTIDKEYQEGF